MRRKAASGALPTCRGSQRLSVVGTVADIFRAGELIGGHQAGRAVRDQDARATELPDVGDISSIVPTRLNNASFGRPEV
jgi:hypothetical protein